MLRKRQPATRPAAAVERWAVLDVASIPNVCVLEAMPARLDASGQPVLT